MARLLRKRAGTAETLARNHKGVICLITSRHEIVLFNERGRRDMRLCEITMLQACWWAVAAGWGNRMAFVWKSVGDRLYVKGDLRVGS